MTAFPDQYGGCISTRDTFCYSQVLYQGSISIPFRNRHKQVNTNGLRRQPHQQTALKSMLEQNSSQRGLNPKKDCLPPQTREDSMNRRLSNIPRATTVFQ